MCRNREESTEVFDGPGIQLFNSFNFIAHQTDNIID